MRRVRRERGLRSGWRERSGPRVARALNDFCEAIDETRGQVRLPRDCQQRRAGEAEPRDAHPPGYLTRGKGSDALPLPDRFSRAPIAVTAGGRSIFADACEARVDRADRPRLPSTRNEAVSYMWGCVDELLCALIVIYWFGTFELDVWHGILN